MAPPENDITLDLFKEELQRWKALERTAIEAEVALKKLGALAAGPEAKKLFQEAAAARRAADEYLDSIVGSTRPPSP